MTWDLSCPDWEERLRTGRSLVPTLPIDQAAGARAVAMLNKLRLADVPGTPTLGEAGGDWFRDIVRAMFGAWDRQAMVRHIVELFLLVPKKNSKTTNGALMMLVALLMNERPNAPFALMAPVQDTAEEAFSAAAGAIELDEVLAKRFHVRSHLKTIVDRVTKADLQIMTFDPDVLTGRKFAGALLDEVHIIAKNAKAAKALRQIRGGMVPFPEGFLAMITTMPDDAPAGVMKAELTKARSVRDGKSTGKTLPVLYELPRAIQEDKEAWREKAVWAQVTPNLNRSVTLAKLQELYDDAAEKGDDELRGWASQHINLEIGLALSSDRWAGAEFWEPQARYPGLTLDALVSMSEVVVCGVDGGGLDDLLALGVIGRHRHTKEWLTWTHAWAHPSVLKRRQTEAPRLLDFEKDGNLTIVKKIGDDVADLSERVGSIDRRGVLHQVGADPAGVGAVLDGLEAEGVPAEKIVGVSQGWKLSGTIKTAERKLAEGVMVHGGQALMNWAVGNAKTVQVGNALTITKQASGTAKIDPLMAVFDAVQLMALNPPAATVEPSIRWL